MLLAILLKTFVWDKKEDPSKQPLWAVGLFWLAVVLLVTASVIAACRKQNGMLTWQTTLLAVLFPECYLLYTFITASPQQMSSSPFRAEGYPRSMSPVTGLGYPSERRSMSPVTGLGYPGAQGSMSPVTGLGYPGARGSMSPVTGLGGVEGY